MRKAQPSCQNGERPASTWAWCGRVAAALLAALLLGGCGTLPGPGPRPESRALGAHGEGNLARIAQASTPPGAELSGFRLLPLGAYALDARLQLAQRARISLDVQYYVIENDATGRLLLRTLREAAARGVRVRLLVDDPTWPARSGRR
jgi:putative cardiolipin synthase